MTITLPHEQESILSRLVARGRYASREAALAEAVRRLEEEEPALIFVPFTSGELHEIYAPDKEWESVERVLAGQCG